MAKDDQTAIAGAACLSLGNALSLPPGKSYERVDEQEIKALYLRIGGRAVCLLSADLCVIRRAHTAQVTAAAAAVLGLPSSHVHLYVTHTHAPGSLKPYHLDRLIQRAGTAAREAKTVARGVQQAAYVSVDTKSQFNLNRRTQSDELGTWCLMQSKGCRDDGTVVDGTEWVRMKMKEAGVSPEDLRLIQGPYRADRPCDMDLQMVLFPAVTGGYAGGLVRFTGHAVTCSSGYWKPNVGRDYPGVLCDRLAAAFGCPMLFIQGPAADHRCRHHAVGLAERDRIGNGLADALIAGLPQARRFPLTDLGVAVESVTCGVRSDLPASRVEAKIRLQAVQEELAGLHGGTLASLRERKRLEEQRWFYNKLANVDGFLEYLDPDEIRTGAVALPVSVMRIGKLRLVNFPGELFSTAVAGLKTGHPDPVLVCSYADGVAGYLLPPADFQEGGYEATSALVAPDTVPRLREAALRLLEQADGATLKRT